MLFNYRLLSKALISSVILTNPYKTVLPQFSEHHLIFFKDFVDYGFEYWFKLHGNNQGDGKLVHHRMSYGNFFTAFLLLFLKVLIPFSLTDSVQSFLHWL